MIYGIITNEKKHEERIGMMNNTNSEGYPDPTACEAIRKVDASRKKKRKSKDLLRFEQLLHVIFNICELSGYHLECKIVVRDKKTGRIWR